MDYLCDNYPVESIWFFKRAIQMTVITGISLVIPTASCIYATWNSPNGSDRSLRYWSVFRVLIFLVQIPLRYRIWQMLHACSREAAQRNNELFEISRKLAQILQTKEWKLTQYFSGLLSAWVGVTLAITFAMETNFPTQQSPDFEKAAFACYRGYLSPCLYRLCWVSIGILCVHVAFVFLWLRNVLNSGDYNGSLTGVTPLLLRQVSTTVKYNNNNKIHLNDFDKCSICLEDYHYSEEIRIFNYCHHHYHSPCIGEWLNEHARCPLCNHLILQGIQNCNQHSIENNNNNNNNNNNVPIIQPIESSNDINNSSDTNANHSESNTNTNNNDASRNTNKNTNTNNNHENVNKNVNKNQEKSDGNDVKNSSNTTNNDKINIFPQLTLTNESNDTDTMTTSTSMNSSSSSSTRRRCRDRYLHYRPLTPPVTSLAATLSRARHHQRVRNGSNRKRMLSPQAPNTPLRATWAYVRLSQN